ncbi:hypothetical protein HYPSUDRAFT_585466 [Hypholoma sublateritium FD-334 SS-4]|uniref:Uncharacterized protein n=1 Tax=Hypholoma sublateritium (strain FD-334 SS-4) TaxID=945553 RepID=A0A0D2L817_HYPSF|nr:hypothetical protein HYPSUDRAFT_585466 [Hypholoma sublateritium FD-334 SS-4]
MRHPPLSGSLTYDSSLFLCIFYLSNVSSWSAPIQCLIFLVQTESTRSRPYTTIWSRCCGSVRYILLPHVCETISTGHARGYMLMQPYPQQINKDDVRLLALRLCMRTNF